MFSLLRHTESSVEHFDDTLVFINLTVSKIKWYYFDGEEMKMGFFLLLTKISTQQNLHLSVCMFELYL